MALDRLWLDRVWWIVTPGNPLKDATELAPTRERVEGARRIAADPRIDVTAFEGDIGARYTVDTLSFLRRRYPDVRFVWIMGADNLATFHRWRGWRQIAGLMPFAVVDRPGWTLKALRSRAAIGLASSRIREGDARMLPDLEPPAWAFLHGPRSSLSSSALRSGLRTSVFEGR
jgi:nicotinate-nucleotide adenylyltransferase